ncbi:MAG: RIO1 family regulatory kinase/ATPase [Myxococcota bacterium]
MAIPDNLALLLDDGVIQEVLGRIMSGKEAEVFAVLRNGQPCAAKVYKERHNRLFKNNAAYLEGRNNVRDSRARRAMASGSRFGKDQAEKSWKDAEHDALQLAWHAGVRVPQPLLMYEGVLIMQLVVDEEGMPAPRLSDLTFPREHAAALWHDLFESVRRLLSCHRIHGDLSAYNVLMGLDGPTIIDMPQVIDAAANPQAESFLVRDVRNLAEYLSRFDPSLAAVAGAGKPLWRHYRNGTLDRADAMEADVLDGRRKWGKPTQPTRRGPPEPARQALADGRVEVVINNRERQGRRFTRDGRFNNRPNVDQEAPRGGGQGHGNPRHHQNQERASQGQRPPQNGPRPSSPPRPAPQDGNAQQQQAGPGGGGNRPRRRRRGRGGAPAGGMPTPGNTAPVA